jgi:hypothetical protein
VAEGIERDDLLRSAHCGCGRISAVGWVLVRSGAARVHRAGRDRQRDRPNRSRHGRR